jgi:hypothetical protein
MSGFADDLTPIIDGHRVLHRDRVLNLDLGRRELPDRRNVIGKPEIHIVVDRVLKSLRAQWRAAPVHDDHGKAELRESLRIAGELSAEKSMRPAVASTRIMFWIPQSPSVIFDSILHSE